MDYVTECPFCNYKFFCLKKDKETQCPNCGRYHTLKESPSSILTLSDEAKALEEIRKERVLLNKQASFISSLQKNLLEVIHDNSVELTSIIQKQIALDLAEKEILLNEPKRYSRE